MLFNSKDIIEALSDKDFNKAAGIAKKGLAEVSLSYIDHAKMTSSKGMVSEAETPPDKEDVQGTEDDPTLDPSKDREYFLKSFEQGDVLITIKTIGVGKNKPVSVYIDDVRWEMFPGPTNAEKEAKKFIKTKQYDLWRDRKNLSNGVVDEPEPKKEEEKEIKVKKKVKKKKKVVKESINFLETVDMTVGGKTFTVSIANTPESLQKGLMFETDMDTDRGILLVFEEPARHGIWMKDTSIPLDVVWMTEVGTVVDVQRLQPHDITIKYPHAPAKYVLELNAGEFTGRIGDIVEMGGFLENELNEISIQGRRNIAKAAKRTAKRRAKTTQRKKKRRKTKEELITKARKMARDKIKKKILKGRSENELSYAAREALEKKVNKMKGKIEKIAKKMLVVAKKQEKERLLAMRAPSEKNEETVLDNIEYIVNNNRREMLVEFDNGDTMQVDETTANTILTMHKALNKRNKIKLREMINKDKHGFMKALKFSLNHLDNVRDLKG